MNRLEKLFPYLVDDSYNITSQQTPSYNCIAWAAGDTARWWWPAGPYYWPSLVPREVTVRAFVAAFGSLGYQLANSGEREEGFEKVALYVGPAGRPTHAARQLASGAWTSKLGRLEDVEHGTPRGV